MDNMWELFYLEWSYEERKSINKELSRDNEIVRENLKRNGLLDSVDTDELDDF